MTVAFRRVTIIGSTTALLELDPAISTAGAHTVAADGVQDGDYVSFSLGIPFDTNRVFDTTIALHWPFTVDDLQVAITDRVENLPTDEARAEANRIATEADGIANNLQLDLARLVRNPNFDPAKVTEAITDAIEELQAALEPPA